MKTFGYDRVSGQGQADGDGPVRQREKIAAFCRTNGLTLARSFSDVVTGKRDGLEREGFAALLQAIDDEGAEAVVVERMDRFARELVVQETLIRELVKRNVKLFSADVGLVDQCNADGDPTRNLIRQILGALAEWEREQIRCKLAIARARVRAKTGKCEGCKPYGFRPGERQIIQLVRNAVAAPLGWDTIAGILNDGGMRTRKRTPWNGNTVRMLWESVKDR